MRDQKILYHILFASATGKENRRQYIESICSAERGFRPHGKQDAFSIYEGTNKRYLYAYPQDGARVEGFYDENGELLSQGSWNEEYQA